MTYKAFYSWQSDKKDVSKKIETALNNKFKEMGNKGIYIELVKATDGISGSRVLEEVILENIKRCDFFIADLTPVTRHITCDGKTKLVPNPNCMLEFGYALRHFNPECVIAYMQLEDDDNHYELPFDLNHRTYNHFKPGVNVKIDENEILRIIDIVNKSIVPDKPEYDCTITFDNDSDSIIITPIFKKIYYSAPYPPQHSHTENTDMSNAISKLIGGSSVIDALHRNRLMIDNIVKPTSIKVAKGRINRSMVPVKLYLHNLGKALDNCKISLWPITEGVEVHQSNEQRDCLLDMTIVSIHDLYIDNDHHSAYKNFTDARNPATQSYIGEVYLKVLPDITDLKIHWKVSARQLMKPCEGDLNISVVPEYEYESKTSTTETGVAIEEWKEDITD